MNHNTKHFYVARMGWGVTIEATNLGVIWLRDFLETRTIHPKDEDIAIDLAHQLTQALGR